ncbi:hypothetical protein BN946_scf184835.g13 [Trametes cinnabarina]|uniref:Endonuclease/exonuclease/phosphatase domain-containing protein n=1 Tax=Pycnoporus cinnabarinus TaxID=5643 RepID=A0A060STE0_PYCCI|nr:hypothetical protein BN946_scf184835.g13 [Trametes cinnabarina]
MDYIVSLETLSTRNTVEPLVLGVDRTPPLNQLSSLDIGPDGWLSIPGNVTLLESVNATLRPDEFGLDFWESLEGQLVTVPWPTATNFPDRFGSIWVYGDWPVTGRNERGGLTIYADDGEVPPAHSETILIGRALDGTRNPKTRMGMNLSNITGVVTYQVENMSPRSHHISTIASHIAGHLHAPDIVFVQEIQDDSGPRDNGVVSANKTLSALVDAIKKASGGVAYHFINVEPEDNKDGGAPGGNIRVAYLWRPERVSLIPGTIGNATLATQPVVDEEGVVELRYAWPSQTFVRSLLELSPDASVIVAGDMNEYLAARAVLRPLTALLHDANAVAGIPPAERYTYAYDQNAQEIDHVFVSDAIATRPGGVEVEHVHVNTWAETMGARASDHDPTVVRLWVCDPEEGLYHDPSGSYRLTLTLIIESDELLNVEELDIEREQIVL